MTREQLRKHDRICFAIAVTIATALTLHMALSTVRGSRTQEQAEPEQETVEASESGETGEPLQEIEAAGTESEEAAVPDRYAVFDTMSADWGGENEGFVYYEIPQEYQDAGGYFPEKMQIYTYCVCKQYGVRYDLVVALIERESGYVFDCVGDDGASLGYMQVNERANMDRMEEMYCTNLLNPYQNVRVGVSILADLIEKYGTIQDALAAYNYGERGARECLWNKGIYVYSYNSGIMNRMKEIEEELRE